MRVMFVAGGIVDGLDEAVLIDVDVRLIAAVLAVLPLAATL
jgi:hypothetical protein